MSSKISVTLKFVQQNKEGKEEIVEVTVTKEVADTILEQLDDCETNVMEVAYAAMRKGMSKQMSQVSKKKVSRAQKKEKK